MTITHCAFWAHNGKYVVVVADDDKDTEAEGHFDILSNRLDQWDEKKLKYKAVVGPVTAACAGGKNNKLSTKVATWLQDHKVEWSVVPSGPESVNDIANNLRTLAEMDPETLAKWTSGKAQLKNLSIKSWVDVRADIGVFLETHNKRGALPLIAGLSETVNEHIAAGKAAYPGILSDAGKTKGKETKILQLFRKAPEAARSTFGDWAVNLDQYLSAITIVETLVAALKTSDRVFYFADPHGAPLPILNRLFTEDYKMELTFTAPASENRDEVSDKDLGSCLDLFSPKKPKGKKKKKGKKGAKKEGGTGGDSKAAADAEDSGDDDDEEEKKEDKKEAPKAAAAAGAGATAGAGAGAATVAPTAAATATPVAATATATAAAPKEETKAKAKATETPAAAAAATTPAPAPAKAKAEPKAKAAAKGEGKKAAKKAPKAEAEE